MRSKFLVPAFFVVMVLAQLYVPASMILDRETIIAEGKVYKFRTAPVDPNDPFRGKYVQLRFKADTWRVKNPDAWQRDEAIYVHLKTDPAGFVRIANVTTEKPTDKNDFVKARVDWVNQYQGKNELQIAYPFDRFYMKETKAPQAETTFNQSRLDTTKTTYALVRIKNGDAVLQDVFIDEIPLAELVKKQLKR